MQQHTHTEDISQIPTKEDLMLALPTLNEIHQSSSLNAYFTSKLSPMMQNLQHTGTDGQILIESLGESIQELYGQEMADICLQQLEKLPIIETGTHLAFMRDYDSASYDDERAHLHQNILISAALIKSLGGMVHIGGYGSNVSLSHACSGGAYQIGQTLFPVDKQNIIKSSTLYDAPSISEKYFNPSVLLVAKLNALSCLIQKKQPINEGQGHKYDKLEKLLSAVLAPLEKSKTNYENVQKEYNKLSVKNREFIDNAIILMADEQEKTGISFQKMDKQYDALKGIFNYRQGLSSQVALIQSNQINDVIEPAGIKHISIDSYEVARQYLIKALKNKDSFWNKLFSNKQQSTDFHNKFVGIRSSWLEDESMFDAVNRNNGYTKTKSLHKDAFDHTPNQIIDLLEKKMIMPSSALLILIFQNAGILAHGGFFQTVYAKKIQSQFVSFLKENNAFVKADSVEKMPVDMACLSLSVLKHQDKPLKLSEIADLSDNDKKTLINDIILSCPGAHAVQSSLPVLIDYLEKTAPGYIMTEAQDKKQRKLIAHHFIVPTHPQQQEKVIARV